MEKTASLCTLGPKIWTWPTCGSKITTSCTSNKTLSTSWKNMAVLTSQQSLLRSKLGRMLKREPSHPSELHLRQSRNKLQQQIKQLINKEVWAYPPSKKAKLPSQNLLNKQRSFNRLKTKMKNSRKPLRPLRIRINRRPSRILKRRRKISRKSLTTSWKRKTHMPRNWENSKLLWLDWKARRCLHTPN